MKNREVLKKYNILYVEDNREIAEELEFFLTPICNNFYSGYNGEEGLALFKKHRPSIVITDIEMPKMNGINMIQEMKKIDNDVAVVITTAFNETDYLLQAIGLHIDGYLMKPLNLKFLLEMLYKIIEPLELGGKLIQKNRELQEINESLDAIAKAKTRELEYFYNHDPLTGLANFVNLKIELERSKYNNLILLDISNFSMINKQYGKQYANEILKAVAEKLLEHKRQDMRLFKIESDRFVFLSKELDNSELETFCQQLIAYYDTQTINLQELEVEVNFSIGVAKIIEQFFPLVNAEYALDIGKSIGSRYYHFYDDSQESIEATKETIKWINKTKEMIVNEAIEPYYQPILDIATGEIVKYEVLARGNYNGELLLPSTFLGSVEKLGLMSSITRMMIRKSFKYFQDKDISFSINITQRDLLDQNLLIFLEQKLELYSMSPTRVTFEIIESVTIGEEHQMVFEQLSALKTMGFKIAIDDFGIENSNFSRLLEIDFDYIKLDGLFIKNIVENTKDQIVVSAIVNLAKTLGIETIAEYVATEEIMHIVKACGVDYAQGYIVGKAEKTIV